MKKAALFLLSLIPFLACEPTSIKEDVRSDSSSNAPDSLAPDQIHTSSPIQKISAGIVHTCMINNDGSISCWGSNDENEAPAHLDGPFTAVSAGGYHTCAIRSNGSIACWGQNDDDESPASVDGAFTSVSAGWHHACGLRQDGAILCWGKNSDKQAPTILIGPFAAVSCGGYHTCALRKNGEATCWGSNDGNQAPTSIEGAFVSISAGWEHTCAIKTDKTIKCWGFNSRGQAPDAINEAFDSISSGTLYTCAIKISDKTLECWGWNGNGQAPPSINEPFAFVAAGENHTCAIKTNGKLTCFGRNDLLPVAPCSWAKNYNPTAFGMDVPENMCQPTSCLLTMANHEDLGLNALIKHSPNTICVRIVKDINDPSIKPKLKLFGFDLLPDRTAKINGVTFGAPSPTAIIYEDSTINQSVLNTPSDGFNYAEITPTASVTFPYDDVRPLIWHFVQEKDDTP